MEKAMEQGTILFTIPFKPLLYKICLALGFGPPIFNSRSCLVHECYVLVCGSNAPESIVFFGGDEGSFADSAERAAKKMVLHLVKKYDLRVDDVNLERCDELEQILHVFELKRKQLEMVEKRIPSMPIADWASEDVAVHSSPVVSIDFFALLSEVVTKLEIPVTRVEYLQYQVNDFRAWMGVMYGGIAANGRWFESERCESMTVARQHLARKVIRELMVMYQFKVDDVNYNNVHAGLMKSNLERESFLTVKERIYQVKEDSIARPFLEQEMDLTPKGVEFAIPSVVAAPKPPKKRSYPSSSRAFCDLIPDSSIPLNLEKQDGSHRRRGHGTYESRRFQRVDEQSVEGSSASQARNRRRCRRRNCPRAAVQDNVPSSPHLLEPQDPCIHCGAFKFQYESPGFCCSSGEVKVPIHEGPKELVDLFRGNDDDSLNFRIYSRLFNNMFAFSSLGGAITTETYRHIYVFKLHGQIYHYLPNLMPDNQNPKYLQLYFYDAAHEHEIRSGLFPELRPTVMAKLMQIMQSNPYAQFFRSLRDRTIDETTTIRINKNPILDQRVYNEPSSSEVAAILLDSSASSDSNGPYIVVSGRSNRTHRIMHYYGCYDPLAYPLLFPHGQSGWHAGLPRYKRNSLQAPSLYIDPVRIADSAQSIIRQEEEMAADGTSSKAKQISCREHYCYLLQMRKDNEGKHHFLLDGERAYQQFVVDMYVKLENTRLDFYRNNQSSIRADLYQGVIDTAERGEDCAANVGHRIILPPSFIGGPRDMRRRYLNAMALVQRFGKPDLFITMTCNPNWQEIKDHLLPGQHSQNRPDLVARVFRAKLIHLKKLLLEKHVFGEVAAYVYVVEFQKRGLPHAHLLIILKQEFKLRCPEDYDRFVCAEIPPTTQPYLRRLVLNHMMHGPCGTLDPKCGCMKESKGQKRCRFNFPKDYAPFTTTNHEGYPTYKRTNSGEYFTKKGVQLDNRWVIPYSPYLLALFDCHINVEVCANISAVKYLYKYIYKGHDRISFNISSSTDQPVHDEIENFQSGRWISPPEAAWRIFGFSLYEMHPPVVPLQVHLDNMHSICFEPAESLTSILADGARSRTPLTEFFRLNQMRPNGPKYLYSEFPEHFTWDTRSKTWNDRNKGFAIGRMAFVNPSESDRYYLRLLLTDVRGPTSFEDLLTVNGHVYSSFQEAAIGRGLVEQSDGIERCLDEAIVIQMPAALRRLFVTLLIFCDPPNPSLLWDKYYEHLSEDFRNQYPNSQQTVLSLVVRQIIQILESMGKSLDQFGLTHLQESIPEDIRVIRDIQDVLDAPIPQEYLDARRQLNVRQREAYKCIVRHVKDNKAGLFFIDGPGGTGKTFLYCTIYAKIRSLGKIVLPTASSGIAASNLPCGRTAHSRFKLPIDLETSLACGVPKQGALAALLRQTSLIFWDEAPMANKLTIHALDLLLRDICDVDIPFAGKVVVFGGDFRQVLPVLPNKSQKEAVEASLVSSSLWPLFTRFYLIENMRAREDPAFASYLLSLGDGKLQHEEVASVPIPTEMLILFDEDCDPVSSLIENIFPEFLTPPFNPAIFIDRAVLAPKNEEVDIINGSLIDCFPGETATYKSIDVLLNEYSNIYPVEFLHTLTPGGMSPHELILKKECPVMLLRNLDPSGGLCNGTRLICKAFSPNLILCEIATGFAKGQQVMIPRIRLSPSSGSHFPFKFQRTQFPIKLSFAMTINKSQGQTLDNVGIYLRHQCFSHGQLYVALSRARTSGKVKVISQKNETDASANSVRNVVSYEVLRRACITM